MSHQPPWGPQYDLPGPEEGSGFDLGMFGFVNGNSHRAEVGAESDPSSAPDTLSAPSFGVSHDYSTGHGVIESASFAPSTTFGLDPNAAHPTNPAPPTGQFPQASNWVPPPDWYAPNTPSLLTSHSYVASQAPVLRSTPGFRTALGSTLPYTGQEASWMTTNSTARQTLPQLLQLQQQPSLHFGPGHRSTDGPQSFLQRKLQRLGRSSRREVDTLSCWQCKSSHKKCDSMNPCGRCATSRRSLAIPCTRGNVCDPVAEVPFVCHPLQVPSQLAPGLPSHLQPSANLLHHTRQRKDRDIDKLKRQKCVRNDTDQDVLDRVVNITVPNIRGYSRFQEAGLCETLVLPYDQLIISIVWKLKDNPESARLAGVGDVEDLVAFLEAACLWEAEFGHHKRERRLVFTAMRCLVHCLEALRLWADGLLTSSSHPRVHSHCTRARQCVAPAFAGLTKNINRYAEALTMDLLGKNKGKENWLLVFYSLCIQGYVRSALMSLERRLQSAEPLAAGGASVAPLCSAKFLQQAVSLFGQISMRNKSKLLNYLRSARPKPSVYLQESPDSSHTRAGHCPKWQRWLEEGVVEYLGRVFQIRTNDSAIRYYPQHTEPESPDRGANGSDSDSDATVIMRPPPETMAMETEMDVLIDVVGGVSSGISSGISIGDAEPDGDSGCGTVPWPRSTPAPSVIDSMWSRSVTDDSESSDLWTLDMASVITPSSPAFPGSSTSSVVSFSTVTAGDDVGFDQGFDNGFDHDVAHFDYGLYYRH